MIVNKNDTIVVMVSIMMAALLIGCGAGGGSDTSMTTILYQGQIYGDFITLYAMFEACTGIEKAPPRIIVTRERFLCGDIWAGGCYDPGSKVITMIGPEYAVSKDYNNLNDTQGSLFSHELAHYFFGMEESHPCGSIYLMGFNWERGL